MPLRCPDSEGRLCLLLLTAFLQHSITPNMTRSRPSYPAHVLFSLSLLISVAEWAAAGYAWWSAASTLGYSVDFRPLVDPGPSSNVYWASQFYVDRENGGGYFGLQSPREEGNGGLFLWSIWAATGYSADGSPGTYCGTFEEDGTGYTCRFRYAWNRGFTYRFNMSYLGNGWRRLVVSELETGFSFNLGRIRFDGVITGGVNWVEYFDWNDRDFDWNGAPASKLVWTNLLTKSSAGLSKPTFSSTDPDMLISPDGRVATSINYPMRSTQLPLRNRGTGRCLAVKGTVPCPPLISWVSPSRDELWTLTNSSAKVPTQIRAYSTCLTASTSTPPIISFPSPCGSNAWSQTPSSSWLVNLTSGTIRPLSSPTLCLTSTKTTLTLIKCDGSVSQSWMSWDRYAQPAVWSIGPAKARAGFPLIFKAILSRPSNVAITASVRTNGTGGRWSLDNATFTSLGSSVVLPRLRTTVFLSFPTRSDASYSAILLSLPGAMTIGQISPSVIKWTLSNPSVPASSAYMIWKLELNAPAPSDTWTCLTSDTTSSPHVSGFWNDRDQVSLDGRTWGWDVYYGNCVIVPTGSRSLFVRLAIQAGAIPGETVRMSVTESGAGIAKGPYTATGKLV